MKRIFFSLLMVATLGFNLNAQVVFRIISLPSNTPANASFFLAGDFNTWNPASTAHQFNTTINGDPALILDLNGSISCKLTRGSWATVEGNASGTFLPNRQYTVSSGDTVLIGVQSWEDLGTGGGSGSGTALLSVSVMSESFFMPQLNRSRRIWICLPEDYQTQPNKRYRTVYLQDGQNLFNDDLSFAGEWGIDESMRDLFLAGDSGAIIIGIENGGANRLNEYSPWVNPNYGGGEGDEYADFLKNTLKPYIDANYRTKPEPAHSAIGGSSMGALISLYAAGRYPETFGKVAVFSPAFWFTYEPLLNWINGLSLPASMRVYFVAGTNESTSMVAHMQQVKSSLTGAGVADSNLLLVAKTDGAHSEWFWKREYPAAYTWLFSQSNSPLELPVYDFNNTRLFPNPAQEQVMVCGEFNQPVTFEILDVQGRLKRKGNFSSDCEQLPTWDLPSGLYLLRFTEGDKPVGRPIRFVKN